MSLAGDILADGLGVLSETHGGQSATLRQGGESYAVTGLLVTSRRRDPQGGDKDIEEITATVQVTGVSVRPQIEAELVLADETRWLVSDVDPIAVGSEPVAWRVSLRTWTQREQETGEDE